MRTPGPESSSRRRSSPSGPRAGGREPAAAQGPSGRPRRAGSTAPAASRLEGDGQAVRLWNDVPGPAAVERVFMLDYGWGFGGADGAPGG